MLSKQQAAEANWGKRLLKEFSSLPVKGYANRMREKQTSLQASWHDNFEMVANKAPNKESKPQIKIL